MGSLEISGTVDRDYLERQLAQLEPRFQACYARALRWKRDSEGDIRLAVQGGGGRLQPQVVENTTSDTLLTNCVTRSVGELAIVEPEGMEPWDFTADWRMSFEIARREPRQETS